MKPDPIRNNIICIPGYMQRMNRMDQGMPMLWHLLWHLYHTIANVSLYTWDSDWSGVAECIWRTGRNGMKPRVLIVAYSWGGGYGAIHLARELRARGVNVETMVLSDAVYHFGGRWAHKLKIAQVMAYLGSCAIFLKSIFIPRNVGKVIAFNQDCSWPMGNRIIRESTGEEVTRQYVDGVTHSNMDELDAFTEAALSAAAEMYGRGT